MALAGHLALQGHPVALWNRSPGPIAAVADLRGVRLTVPGEDQPTFAPLAAATCRMGAALADARRILVAVPASAHADIARACAPYLRDGQTVLLLPGRTGGALEFRRVLREAGCRADVLLGEASTFPFAARSAGAASMIYGAKADVMAAALPAQRTAELVQTWSPLLPMLSRARSVLHTGLSNVGAILHPVITLLNADRIEKAAPFDFYTDGVTPAVAAALEAADLERCAVARAYGEYVESLPTWIASSYGHHADTFLEAVGGNPAYVGIKAPTTLNHRYLLEDVPTGLVPLLELGAAAELALPMLRSLVKLARMKLNGARWENPRTLEALGLGGLTARGIRHFIEPGLASPSQPVDLAGVIPAGNFGSASSAFSANAATVAAQAG
jgi:opine dehydrogenase